MFVPQNTISHSIGCRFVCVPPSCVNTMTVFVLKPWLGADSDNRLQYVKMLRQVKVYVRTAGTVRQARNLASID